MELAFLRSCLAWESFLEDSFLLYILGKKPRLRKLPRKRYIFPTGGKHARTIILPEGGSYAEWDKPDKVVQRAKRLLKGGEPFESAITPRRSALLEMQTTRNAIAHRSSFSQLTFEKLARNKLGSLPPDFSVGTFLETIIPHSVPPTTPFDNYLEAIETAARLIGR